MYMEKSPNCVSFNSKSGDGVGKTSTVLFTMKISYEFVLNFVLGERPIEQMNA